MSDLATVLVAGLGAAATFRAGDVSGGIARKRDPVVRVAALSHLLSLAHVLLAVATGEAVPKPADLAWGDFHRR